MNAQRHRNIATRLAMHRPSTHFGSMDSVRQAMEIEQARSRARHEQLLADSAAQSERMDRLQKQSSSWHQDKAHSGASWQPYQPLHAPRRQRLAHPESASLAESQSDFRLLWNLDEQRTEVLKPGYRLDLTTLCEPVIDFLGTLIALCVIAAIWFW